MDPGHGPGGMARASALLFVFGFSNTLTENSADVAVLEELGLGPQVREWLCAPKNERQHWADIRNALFSSFSLERVREAAARSIEVTDGMIRAMALIGELQAASSRDPSALQVEVCIASDSNTAIIAEICKKHFPTVSVAQIHSNRLESASDPSSPAIGTTRLDWYMPPGTNPCRQCVGSHRDNMCKSVVLQRILERTQLQDPVVFYCGSAESDYCPARNMLRLRDIIAPRAGLGLHQALDTLGGDVASVLPWSSGDDFFSCFSAFVRKQSSVGKAGSAVLPPLTLFHDCVDQISGQPLPHSFRHVTLAKRMPLIARQCFAANRTAGTLSPFCERAVEQLAASTASNGVLRDAVETGATTNLHIPSWVARYRRGDSAADEKRGADACWGDLPWLHGEMYFYHLLMNIFGFEAAAAQNTAVVLPSPFLGGWHRHHESDAALDVAELWSPVIKSRSFALAPTFAPTVSLPLPPTNPHDFYREDKLNSIAIMMNSHILPLTRGGPCAACSPAAAGTATAAEPVNGFVERGVAVWEQWDLLPQLLRQCLWGNGVDLSMFTLENIKEQQRQSGASSTVTDQSTASTAHPLECVDALDSQLVSHPSEIVRLASHIQSVILGSAGPSANTVGGCRSFQPPPPPKIDIVMDNVGVECCADLLLALYIIHHGQRIGAGDVTVVLHVKPAPFYVSDVAPWDIEVLLQEISKADAARIARTNGGSGGADGASSSARFVAAVRAAISSGAMRLAIHPFWVAPTEWRDMTGPLCKAHFFARAPRGDVTASEGDALRLQPLSSLVIAKGDLNFRRVIGDRHWWVGGTTSYPSVAEAVCDYWPRHADGAFVVPLALLRTVKCELLAGADPSRVPPPIAGAVDWRLTGKFGQISFVTRAPE